MLLSPKKKREYFLGWRKREDARKQLLGKRKTEALKKARAAAKFLKEKYGVQVYLFGSLAWGGFWEKSDIDLALEGLDDPKQYLKVFGEAWEVVSPFELDLVMFQDIDDDFRNEIRSRGVAL